MSQSSPSCPAAPCRSKQFVGRGFEVSARASRFGYWRSRSYVFRSVGRRAWSTVIGDENLMTRARGGRSYRSERTPFASVAVPWGYAVNPLLQPLRLVIPCRPPTADILSADFGAARLVMQNAGRGARSRRSTDLRAAPSKLRSTYLVHEE